MILATSAAAQTVELYLDQKTQQIFAAPGVGRIKLGTFVAVDRAPSNTESKGAVQEAAQQGGSALPVDSKPTPAPVSAHAAKPWTERFNLRGYTQFRYHTLWDKQGEGDWFHPADATISRDRTFAIRRSRLVLSGDASDHMSVFLQPELFASTGSESDYSLQMRDAYADIALNPERELRARIGQAVIPYGFSALQSSRTRGPLERADAIASFQDSERDVGVFLIWTPKELKNRFAFLTRDGMKGTGDLGIFSIGAYSGQGANRSDQNDTLHTVMRTAYPFKLGENQYLEPSISAYSGYYVPRTQAITGEDGTSFTPTFRDDGVKDQRMDASLVLHPRPLGFELEWNFGEGPELSDDLSTISSSWLQGGYALVNYITTTSVGTFSPFVRWQYFDGARKLSRNSPQMQVNEWEFGLEWLPWSDVRLTLEYALTNDRTNTNTAPYQNITGGQRVGMQVQVSY